MRRRTLFEGDHASLAVHLSDPALQKSYDAELEAWRRDGRIRKLWASDKSLWTGADEDKWTGWLHNVEHELDDVATLQALAEHASGGGFTDVLLLGMGGSSLGPEVLSQTFGSRNGFPKFHMLDSTDPAQVTAVADSVDLARTLVIVSSKSGSTLEPNIYMAYFLDRVREELGVNAAKHFVAVTDPGSSLEKHATELGMQVFHGVKSIGGRYSVLSKFGLVPAAAIGIDVKAFLETTQQMVRACADDVPPAENPGVQLGVAMGVAAREFGRDKVTIVASPGIADLGAWLEQLIAESTGKQGRGLIPVDAEPLGAPDVYGRDRFFAYLELEGGADPEQAAAVDALEKAGNPVARISVKSKMHIGQEFFRWEMAVAVAGSVIGINPFDQPDVEASKIKTRGLTDEYEKTGKLHEDAPLFEAAGVKLFADAANADRLGSQSDLSGYLKALFGQVQAGDYVALLAYVQRDPAHIEALQALRTKIRDKTHAATCVGFGPRFLHSTGQAYKGGPNSGVFLQITCDDPADVAVPGQRYTFGVVKAAQAQGDLGVLNERGRRALRVHLHDVDAGLATLAAAVDEALA
jgi:transaldolase/glucose-6-phosphate isomerase